MENKALETIRRFHMTEPGCRVIVGTSGGADSMALLELLHEARDILRIHVSACHVNHGLRGAESDRDERFVAGFCRERQIALASFRVNAAAVRRKHESMEECARRERYRCFEELLRKDAAARLATAHTASDNEETVLLNLLRGTGTKGLCGIPPVRDRIIRPLIRCTREETEAYCVKHGISYVTDSTNLSEDYARNRLRLRILPLLKEFNPSLTEGISRMTQAVSDDCAFLEKAADQARAQCKAENGYFCDRLAAQEPALRARIFSRILSESGIEPSYLRITGCDGIVREGKGKINLCRDRFAIAAKNIFRIQTCVQKYRDLST